MILSKTFIKQVKYNYLTISIFMNMRMDIIDLQMVLKPKQMVF